MEEKTSAVTAEKTEPKLEVKLESIPVIKKKREDKIRRRDSRALENLLKTFSSLSDSEKFTTLKSKYGELYDEFRKLQNQVAEMEKRHVLVQRERDYAQSEYSKSVLARSRLESLCRELQKQNKIIKDEHISKIKDEEESRKQVAAKFENTLSELTTVMHDSSEKNLKLRDDNLDMANKIAALYKKFEKGQEELIRMEKQMSLEKQLSEATYSKLKMEFSAEREQWVKEREILQQNLQKSEENCEQLQTHMKVLDGHLLRYTGKYEEFESTISKSSQVFDDCKLEIVKMTKQINTLEKELKIWKTRGQRNAKTVLDLTASKQIQEAELLSSEKKIEQLQKLCRQLQVDRAAYIKLLKTNGIEPSSQICIDSAPPQPPPATHKPNKKEQELLLLKNNLKVLKAQFVGLTGNMIDDKGNEIACDDIYEQTEDKTVEEPKQTSEPNLQNTDSTPIGDVPTPEVPIPLINDGSLQLCNGTASVVSNGESTNL